MICFRNQEVEQIQEQGTNQWEKEARIVKTSEDQYERSDSSSSKSSNVDANNQSPQIVNQQQTLIKPEFNRVK